MAARDVAASWEKGSAGESRLATFVAREVGDTVIPLHDRLIPGTRGNIDHIFVAATGVWVIDAKAYNGKVERREVGTSLEALERAVDRREESHQTRQWARKQVAAVIAALKGDASFKRNKRAPRVVPRRI